MKGTGYIIKEIFFKENFGIIYFADIARDCWHHVLLLTMREIPGIIYGYWHRVWLLALCVIAGIASRYWHCVWLFAPCATADIACDC